MAERQDLTEAQQFIVINAQRDVALVMERAQEDLRRAGLPWFDGVDTVHAAIAYVVERGALSTLDALEHV
jgi:hypothetical protein